MTIWQRYSEEERKDYEDYLRMYGALSAMFNQKSSETGAPYLDSKFQETIYAKTFNSEDVDIGNTPHDIRSEFGAEKIGIGLKTWLNSKPSYQKVMQLKSYRSEIDPFLPTAKKDGDPEALANILSKIKNDRLITDYKRLGLTEDSNIYHYVTRDKGVLRLTETSYPLVDISTLKPGKMTKSSFTFSDKYKQYRFSYSDHTIWMHFSEDDPETYLLDTIDVEILKDPFAFLKSAFEKQRGVYIPKTDDEKYLYLPLYSYRDKKVGKRSGLNAWNGNPKSKGSTTIRPEGEAYIPIPKALWAKRPFWVDPNVDMRNYKEYKRKTGRSSYPIRLHMPDGTVFNALFAQAGFKALQTDPQSILGKWILNVLGIKAPRRKSYDQESDNVVTMQLLQKVGFDSVKLWHKDPNNYKDVWIDFAPYGSFERFMNDEVQVND